MPGHAANLSQLAKNFSEKLSDMSKSLAAYRFSVFVVILGELLVRL